MGEVGGVGEEGAKEESAQAVLTVLRVDSCEGVCVCVVCEDVCVRVCVGGGRLMVSQ